MHVFTTMCVYLIFKKKLKHLISKGALNWSKLYIYLKNIYLKNIKQHNYFLMFPGHQISISEWFLKACVTRKTGVMAAENSALPSWE